MVNVFQTDKEEWDAFFAEMYPRWLAWLKANGTSVDAIEEYDSTEGVRCLPARYDRGGVRKTVLVPVSTLSKNADQAATEAKKATEDMRLALERLQSVTDRFTTLCDNPPKIDGDTRTWWVYDEELKQYVDTKISIEFPDDSIVIDKEYFNDINIPTSDKEEDK